MDVDSLVNLGCIRLKGGSELRKYKAVTFTGALHRGHVDYLLFDLFAQVDNDQ